MFLEPIHLPESELFDVGKGVGDQNKQEARKGESMAILLAILDFLFWVSPRSPQPCVHTARRDLPGVL